MNKLYKDIFDHSKIVSVFLSVLIFLLHFSYYHLLVSLAESAHNHNFLSLHVFAHKSHNQGTFLFGWKGWNWAARYPLLKGQLRDLHSEGFVKTGGMKVYKLQGSEERMTFVCLKKKNPLSHICVNFSSKCTLVLTNLLFM